MESPESFGKKYEALCRRFNEVVMVTSSHFLSFENKPKKKELLGETPGQGCVICISRKVDSC
jgi:hypothetical protein